jgi:catechol 2,3-dioxygenase-like lactoylglutathione lyase family enzyme
MTRSLVILYVASQQEARAFYRAVLRVEPSLDVPGMTEFELPGGLGLGLMPEAGIRGLLPGLDRLAPRAAGNGRVELYLGVDDPRAWLERALQAGAVLLDDVRPRDWGDEAGYALDPWGHVLAFARMRPEGVAGS